MKNDFLGNSLEIGDLVVVPAPQYHHLTIARVYAFTPKGARVEFLNTWNFDPKDPRYTQYLAAPSYLTKITTPTEASIAAAAALDAARVKKNLPPISELS